MITAAVLTKNRASQLQKCLNSLAWCDEIIVIDDDSTDNTRYVVQATAKTHYFKHSLNADFADQHNFALDQASHDWVLFVDDDEVVSSKLAQEIVETMKTPKFAGYFLSRLDYFWGQPLAHGETSAVQLLRLAKRGGGTWHRPVHEVWKVTGPIGKLTTPLEHHAHPSIKEFITSINFYTTIDAPALQKEGKGFSYFKLIFYPPAKFFQNYFWRLGFLDSLPGLVMAYMMSLNSLVVRVKQYDLFRAS